MTDEHITRDIAGILAWSAPEPMNISLLSNLLDQPEDEIKPALDAGIAGNWLIKSPQETAYCLTEQARTENRNQFPIAEQNEWVDTVCQRFCDWFEFRRKQSDAQSLLDSQSPHLNAWLENAKKTHPHHACKLTWYSAYPFYYRGELDTSMELVRSALKQLDALPEPNASLKAEMLDDEGAIRLADNNPQDALQSYLSALQIRTGLYGEKHTEIASAYDNIADAYNKSNNTAKSLEYQEKALQLRIGLLGEEHRDTALSYNNIGTSYYEAGRYREALSYLEKSTEIRQKTLGYEHAETIDALTNLTICMINLKKLREAYEMVSRYLKNVPPNHPKHMEISSMLVTIDRECVRSGFRPVSAQKSGGGKKKKKKK